MIATSATAQETSIRDGSITYLSAWVYIEDAEYSQFSGQCFTGAGRRPEQHVMIRVINRVKYLRLNRIEVREPEEH